MRSRRRRRKNEEQEEEKQKRSTHVWEGLTYLSQRSAEWCALSGIPP